jgi:hypothetical protein
MAQTFKLSFVKIGQLVPIFRTITTWNTFSPPLNTESILQGHTNADIDRGVIMTFNV